MSGASRIAGAEREAFGTLDDGTPIEIVTLTNAGGITARVITLGATLQSLEAPDRAGRLDDIVLGYDSAAEYLAGAYYFGASVGRYANRIARGRFMLDGREYRLATNDGANHLHGGKCGFDKCVWTVDSVASEPMPRVVLRHVSANGDQGYPGTLTVTATYTLDADNRLSIEYLATTDAPTIVNITNHSYWNLAGEAAHTDTLDQHLTLHGAYFTPVDDTQVPTGELRPVLGTPFDFRQPIALGAAIREGSDKQLRIGAGFDHNFVVDGEPGRLRPAARLADPGSGRVLTLSVIAPGLQCYSGNALDGTVKGKVQRLYRQGDGLALEPQAFPDSPNQPGFPSVRLDPGDVYANHMVYRFSTQAE